MLESTLLNYANPCRNWTSQRFARVAEKKERNGTNKKSDIRKDLNPGRRLVAPMLHRLSYGVSRQNLNFNPYKLSSHQFIPPLSFLHVDLYRHAILLIMFLFITVSDFYSVPLRFFFSATLAVRWKVQFRQEFA